MSHPPKKKRIDEQSFPSDTGQRPIQVQRRRVWRACESCRRKKIKCDGNEPVCSQCNISKTQCTWLQTKDRAALSRHYVQELETRLLHMEEVFKQVAPMLENLNKNSNGVTASSSATGANSDDVATKPQMPLQDISREFVHSESSPDTSAGSPQGDYGGIDEDVSEPFGQLALDEQGHLRWIGGSSTMSLIQSFRTLTTSPLHRISPMDEDPHSPNPSATKLYFPSSVYFNRVRALPGAEEVIYPERDLADTLVNAYFTRFHFLLPIIDKPSFLESYRYLMDHQTDVDLVRSRAAFVALVFAVFACAARFVDDDRLLDGQSADEGGIGLVYYERALILHYISYRSIEIAHVQCCILLSSFLCSVNCLPQAWLLVGQAVRMGQDLGLHRYSRHILMLPIERETRRKVWWGVYILDRMLALALGRPLGIADSDCDAELPVSIDDDDLAEYFSGAQLQRTQPSLLSGFIAMIDLYKIAGRVCRQVYAIDKCKDNLEEHKLAELMASVAAIDKELSDWYNQLAPVYKMTPISASHMSMGAVLHGHYYSLLTTLHRNFLPIKQNNATNKVSIVKAVSAARSCIRLAPSFKNLVPMSYHLAFFIQQLFSSAVILLLYAMHASDRNLANLAMQEALSSIEAVSAWEGNWPGAKNCRELLSELASTAKDHVEKAKTSQAEESQQKVSPPASNTTLRNSPGSRVIKNKPRRDRSRDSNPSPRQMHTAAVVPGTSHLDQIVGSSTSQKRAHDDSEHVRVINQPSGQLSFSHNLSDSYSAGQGSSSPTTMAGPSFTNNVLEDSAHGFTGSSLFNHNLSPINVIPKSENTNSPSLPLDNKYAQDPAVPTGLRSWNRNYMHELLGTQARGLNYPEPLPYTSEVREPPDEQFIPYDESTMMGYPDPSLTPSSSFRTPGLPFHGLDFIRNYTPDNSYSDGRDTIWQTSYGSGEFKFDPDLQFLSAGYSSYPEHGQ